MQPSMQQRRAPIRPPPPPLRRYSTGRFYCGESDNIVQRLRQHSTAGVRKEGAACMEAAYVVAPDKGAARELQKHVIVALAAAGYPLVSSQDMRLKNFGRGRGAGRAGAMEVAAAPEL
jgi:hypothetical protein